jgi:DNA transformation protein
MFGGAGIYRDELMFALVIGREVYLKSDETSASRFEEAGCRPFTFEREGKQVETSYRSLPEEALDDAEILKRWAEVAYAAALRSKKPKRKRA